MNTVPFTPSSALRTTGCATASYTPALPAPDANTRSKRYSLNDPLPFASTMDFSCICHAVPSASSFELSGRTRTLTWI